MDALNKVMTQRFEIERQVTAAEQAIERGNKRLKELDKQVVQLHALLNKALRDAHEAEINLR